MKDRVENAMMLQLRQMVDSSRYAGATTALKLLCRLARAGLSTPTIGIWSSTLLCQVRPWFDRPFRLRCEKQFLMQPLKPCNQPTTGMTGCCAGPAAAHAHVHMF